jgi:hypothetical protein
VSGRRLQCKVIKWLSLSVESDPIGAADFMNQMKGVLNIPEH